MSGAPRRVAFVLPVFNEAASLTDLHASLAAEVDRRPDLDVEFTFVDDGSRDASVDVILALRAMDSRVSLVSLSRNFGHQVAITAGIDAVAASADAVVVMDADGQDPPPVALELIERWEAGADVVYAQRRSRRDHGLKRLTAWLYYWLLAHVADVHIPRNVGDFRLLDRRVVTELCRYRERDRYLRGIVAQLGYRQEAVLFDRAARTAGSSAYTWRMMRKLAADGILGFSTVPLRLISRLGLVVSLLSAVLACYVLGVRLLTPEQSVPGWAFLGVGMFLLGGVQLLVMGVIGSYVGRVYVETQGRPLYSLDVVARDQSTPRLPGIVGGPT